MLPIDATYQIAPFNIGTPPDYRNDDGSTLTINLPFNFCFYGQIQNQVFINNNGNVIGITNIRTNGVNEFEKVK